MEEEEIKIQQVPDLAETLENQVVEQTLGFKIEGGFIVLKEEELKEQVVDDLFDLTGKDNDFLYFREHFSNKGAREHWTWVAKDIEKFGPIAVSVVLEGETYLALIRTKKRRRKKRNFCTEN